MSWIQKILNQNNRNRVVIVIAVFLALGAGVSEPEQNAKTAVGDSQSRMSRTVMIGGPTLDMTKEIAMNDYLIQGEDFLREGNYAEAVKALEQGIAYANKNKILPMVLHVRLAEVYEAMNDREGFLSEIAWLQEGASKAFVKELAERKRKFFDANQIQKMAKTSKTS